MAKQKKLTTNLNEQEMSEAISKTFDTLRDQAGEDTTIILTAYVRKEGSPHEKTKYIMRNNNASMLDMA